MAKKKKVIFMLTHGDECGCETFEKFKDMYWLIGPWEIVAVILTLYVLNCLERT